MPANHIVTRTAPTDAFVCCVLPANLIPGERSELWRPGPLPLAIPSTLARGRSGNADVADTRARATHFAPRILDVLYGSNEKTGGGRWHASSLPHPASNYRGARLLAWEYVTTPVGWIETSGYVIAHIQLPTDPLPILFELTRRFGGARDWLVSELPAGVRVVPDARAGLVSHLIRPTNAEEPSNSRTLMKATRSWDATDRWLWLLASGMDPESFIPDTHSRDLGARIHLSSDWTALAQRNGVAYCTMTDSGRDGVHELLRVYVRSIHLDGFLLVRMQSDAAHGLADRVSDMDADHVTAEGALKLEADFLKLRGQLWWSHLTTRGSQVDDVVRALQTQLDLPDLYAHLVAELGDRGRLIRLRQAQHDDARETKRDRVLSLVSAAFVTPSVMLTALQLVPEPSLTSVLLFWALSAASSVATWFVVRAWLRRFD